jgi:class 3 adenylate cyclase
VGKLLPVTDFPETRYADTANGQVAYQIVGDAPLDLLVFHPPICPVDLLWDEPMLVRFLERLSTFSRSIWFDPRGRGASDPLPHDEDRFEESSTDDMLGVIDHLGLEQVALLGLETPAFLFAAAHPERTKALVLYNSTARFRWAEDYPDGASAKTMERWLTTMRPTWGTGLTLDLRAPSLADDARVRRWLARGERLLGTPDEMDWRRRAAMAVDLRAILPTVRVPTLVLCRRETRIAPLTRYVAQHIPDAKLVEVPGGDHLFFAGDTTPVLDEIEEYLTGSLPAHRSDRLLATVLFTDVVGSTEQAARLGDRRWKELLGVHDALVEAEIERFRGRMVRSTRDSGDGALATFDGPGRAIRCACAIRDAVRSLGIDVRAGLHSGEIELRGDDVAGLAVHIGARVSALAGAGGVFVSSTVKDLVAGSGIDFEDRGEHELKGVPGSWKVYAVAE